MCDTFVVVRPEGVLFAKNSDRDPNEGQVLEWHARREHPPGIKVRCTWIEIPQVRETNAVLLSRPFWMWGAEIGANEHGVVIGNEAVFTDRPYRKVGLTGMDMLRLTLERTASAEEAVASLISLLEEHGQGGGCGHEHRSFRYHNSFLVADAGSAYVVETADSEYAVERVQSGARSISNGLTIPDFAAAHRDRLRDHVAACHVRTGITGAAVQNATGPADMMAALRSHGDEPWPRYAALNGTLSMPCMHGGGVVASSLSTASWVADLRPESVQHWVTATSSPCLSLFKPVTVHKAVDIGPAPGERSGDGSLWWAHEALHRKVMRAPAELAPLFTSERDELESAWLAHVPDSDAAFADHRSRIEQWTARVDEAAASTSARDARPLWARRYWRKRERTAGA
jgi:dipeptidase